MIQMILLFWRSTVISERISESGLYGEADGTDLQKPVYPAFVKTAGTKVNLHTCVCLMENLMVQRDFFLAEKVLKIMDQNWHRGEEYWIWKIRYLAERKMGKELKQSLQALKEEHIYLSSRGKGGTGILAGWIKK